MHQRDYTAIAGSLRPNGSREQRMTAVVDALWDAFGNHEPMSWVGFYLDQPEKPDETRLLLGPRRDSPACSPIGLHGVCGQALLSREVKIIHDVNDLGDAYIACDPRDRSEIVLPLIDESGESWGVLDIDSWDIGAFDDADARGLRDVLVAAGLTAR